MFDYRLSLATGVDIPIPECQIIIHQPTIKEISLIGEYNFLMGVQTLCLNKTMYVEEEYLDKTTNFQIFMALINSHEEKCQEIKNIVFDIFTLLTPNYKVVFTPRTIVFKKEEETFNIDEDNFDFFQQVLKDIFCLQNTDQNVYNPGNKAAKRIADKLMKGRQKVAQLNQNQKSSSMFGQYLSILVVGLDSMSLKDCMELTMYQLYDLIERFNLYTSWDIDIRSRMVFGASGSDKPIENWMKSIH